MKAILTIAALAAGIATSANAAQHVWTVSQIHRHAWQLHGKVIIVRGWLPKCQRLDCSLFDSKLDADRFYDNPSAHPLLGIGADRQFDSSVAGKLPAEILLRAKVDATCIAPKNRVDRNGNQLITVCVDRVNELQPIQLIRLQSAAGKSAKVGK